MTFRELGSDRDDWARLEMLMWDQTSFQREPVPDEVVKAVTRFNLNYIGQVGSRFYGEFTDDGELLGAVHMQEWVGWPGEWNMGIQVIRKGRARTYEADPTGVISDQRLSLINGAVNAIVAEGCDTLWTISRDVDGYPLIWNFEGSVLYPWSKVITEYVEAGTHWNPNDYPWTNPIVGYQRFEPRSYLIPLPMSKRQRIYRLKKVE